MVDFGSGLLSSNSSPSLQHQKNLRLQKPSGLSKTIICNFLKLRKYLNFNERSFASKHIWWWFKMLNAVYENDKKESIIVQYYF